MDKRDTVTHIRDRSSELDTLNYLCTLTVSLSSDEGQRGQTRGIVSALGV